ncbi:hypothetical protein N9R54_05295 [Pelobium sp.]|nr:hypothetical protein [Pelobium sp.]MDA9555634.1 hypothetical protein [Pelobium sp.]
MEYTVAGNIFENNKTTIELKEGDFMIYDRINTSQNGRFKTLDEFKIWLSEICEFEFIDRFEHLDSRFYYKINALKEPN